MAQHVGSQSVAKLMCSRSWGVDATDATRMNAFLEQEIERLPDQYYWVDRLFKNLPADVAAVY
ncbi:hypothetical protein U875_25030 [Pandoraea pnomenusa 3kgm]|nr:hypothetical protein X636_07510 [Pandoraea pnomenusa]AIM43898.1 hypothetical protein U875_25030 [Pandoraea pnomenusa 3kgm]